MKQTRLLTALAVLVTTVAVAASQADAAVLRYRASGDWTLITDGASPGWGPNPVGVGTSLPGASDDARINFGGNTVQVTSAVPAVSRVQIGVDESGILVVDNGGVLTTTTASGNGDLLAGNNNSNATGTLMVNDGGTVNVGRILWSANNSSNGVVTINSGGQVNVASHLWWGVTGTTVANISGTLTQTGGILGLGTNNASTPSGGTATVNILDGGRFELNNISSAAGLPSIQAGSLINISGSGEVVLPGDFEGVLNDYVDAGLIVGNLGLSTVTVDQIKNPGSTTAYINLIPEPASALLLSFGLIGVAVRRRR